jgi:hypothetical protein
VLSEALSLKHSREWMQLAIDELYRKLKVWSEVAIFPMTVNEKLVLNRYSFLLRVVKRHKMQSLLNFNKPSVANSTESSRQPVGFKNLSDHSFTIQQEELLNKGPSYVPPPPPII